MDVLDKINEFVAENEYGWILVRIKTNLTGDFKAFPKEEIMEDPFEMSVTFRFTGKTGIFNVYVPYLVDDKGAMLSNIYSVKSGLYHPYCTAIGRRIDVPIVDCKPDWPENIHLLADGHDWFADVESIAYVTVS
jgi:hypothetical protein